MQDLSRDELNLIQSACDKDSISTYGDSALERLKLNRTTEFETASSSIKLEENSNIYPWHITNKDIGSNLL